MCQETPTLLSVMCFSNQSDTHLTPSLQLREVSMSTKYNLTLQHGF